MTRIMMFLPLALLCQVSTPAADPQLGNPVHYDLNCAWAVCNGDFDGDGWVDIATVAYCPSRHLVILQNLGEGSFAIDSTYPLPDVSGSWQNDVSAADFNADGFDDLAVGGTDTLSVLLSVGDGSFSPPTHYAVKNPAVCTADMNGDSLIDIVGPKSVLLNTGAGRFNDSIVYGSAAPAVATGDLDGDGDVDVVTKWAHESGDVYFNDGSGHLTFGLTYEVPQSGVTTTAVADMNMDGVADLVTAAGYGGSPGVYVLLNDGTGSFPAVDVYPTKGQSWVLTADLDRGGYPDVVTLGYNRALELLNDGSGGLYPFTETLTGGYDGWEGTMADFNNDGAPDIFMTDAGRDEPKYKCTVLFGKGGCQIDESPCPCCTDAGGDVDGNGGTDIADLTYLVNYSFKNGPPPVCK